MNKFLPILFCSSYLLLSNLHANPIGGQVTDGTANITHQNNLTTINQSTSSAIIEWDSFNIQQHEQTHFEQPDSSSITLNRIKDANPSSIFGQLSATGQVMLINQNGILFGPNSQIDVAGFVGSTLDITNEDFLAEEFNFKATQAHGLIHHQGKMNIKDGGYAALFAPQIQSDGKITAKLGKVALAAGEAITLDFTDNDLVSFSINDETKIQIAQINHSGHIKADGGLVVLSTQIMDDTIKGVINMDGVIEARTIENINGEIRLLADTINLQNAELNVDAQVKEAGVIRIAAEQNLYADTQTTLSAKGQAQADAGFIALAAAEDYQVDASIIIDAAQGEGGWLYTGDDTELARYIENPNNLQEIGQNNDGTFSLSFEYYDKNGHYSSKGINLKTIIGEDDTYFAIVDENEDIVWAKKSFLNTNEDSTTFGQMQGAGVTNYLVGTRDQWVTGVKHYKRVVRKNMYNGIDMVYYGNAQNDLEYDLKVNPGADYKQIKFNYSDADSITLTDQGRLKIIYGDKAIYQNRPVVYQEDGNNKRVISSKYSLDSDNNVSFILGDYDTSKPLIIDPVVKDDNFGIVNLGSSNENIHHSGVSVLDDSGYIYMVGNTTSADFPITPGAFQSSFAFQKGFYTKFSPTGQVLYSTFIGGDGATDTAQVIRIDRDNNVHIMGTTDSSQASFAGGGLADVFQTGCVGCTRGYYVKLNNEGTALLNGASIEDDPAESIQYIEDFVLNSNGDISFVFTMNFGETFTPTGNCPFNGGCPANANQLILGMFDKNNVAKFGHTIEGATSTEGTFLQIDNDDNLYLTAAAGNTFPGIDSRFVDNGGAGVNNSVIYIKLAKNDAINSYDPLFITKFGSSNIDFPRDIFVDSAKNVYIAGATTGDDFLTTADAYQKTRDSSEGFITIFDSSNNIDYSTYYGFTNYDRIDRISVTDAGRIVVAGVIYPATVAGMTFTEEVPLKSYQALLTTYPGDIRSNYISIFDKSRQSVIYNSLAGTAGDDYYVRGLFTNGSLDTLEGLNVFFVNTSFLGDGYQNFLRFTLKNTAAALLDEIVSTVEASIDNTQSFVEDAICDNAVIL